MNISTIFFDLDDTLYPASSGLWPLIKDRIGLFMRDRLDIPTGEVQPLRKRLFEEYGTTLRGLQKNYSFDVNEFLAFVHDVPLADYIRPDPVLRSVLKSLTAKKYIFTNADVKHAQRVLKVLNLEDCFGGIIDVVALDPYCKPMPESFKIALQIAHEQEAQNCILIDDIPRTTQAARDQGMYAILYGNHAVPGMADAHLDDWSELPGLLEERA
ncbi:MAG TPA: pyrimidine 5'-nucleotidase [Anaerolineales bacterium]